MITALPVLHDEDSEGYLIGIDEQSLQMAKEGYPLEIEIDHDDFDWIILVAETDGICMVPDIAPDSVCVILTDAILEQITDGNLYGWDHPEITIFLHYGTSAELLDRVRQFNNHVDVNAAPTERFKPGLN